MKTIIKEMPEFARPREKLIEKGPKALSDIELLAVILGSGNKENSVITLASKIALLLSECNGNLSIEKLTEIRGIGTVKASQILSGFELARRHINKGPVRINSPEKAIPLVTEIAEKKQEYFICISLNGANEIIKKRVITVGLLNRCQVHPREVFSDVIADRAASVIFAHNHPSGDLKPSRQDLDFHKQLIEAGNILGINIFDHFIISEKGYFSFYEDGIL